jgi:hypothetical protein
VYFYLRLAPYSPAGFWQLLFGFSLELGFWILEFQSSGSNRSASLIPIRQQAAMRCGSKTFNVQLVPCNLCRLCQRTPAPIRPVINPFGPTHPRYYHLSKKGGMRWKTNFAFFSFNFIFRANGYPPSTNIHQPLSPVHKFNTNFEIIAPPQKYFLPAFIHIHLWL